jgi:hypothetical protein
MEEIWKDIPDYEGFYQVSNLGRIKSLKRIVYQHGIYPFTSKEKILKQNISSNGYFIVGLFKNNKRKTQNTHQIVAIAFLNHKPDGTRKIVVDHINNIKTDNRVENLQLITTRENLSKDKKGNSKYIGVYWCEKTKRYKSQIRTNFKQKYLGSFINEYDAHLAYQKALKEILNN